MKNFALIGVGGFVAPRHLKAIRDTGNRLLAAVDLSDSVGVLDRYFPEARFFTEIERFDRHLEKVRRRNDSAGVRWVSICSPNYLHDAHVRLALRVNADAICEKPLVISPWNLDQLAEIEVESGRRVWTVLQLRTHPTLIALRDNLQAQTNRSRADVVLTYVTRRGPWYGISWKGSAEKSGGVAMNIGVHFFDMLGWVFGSVQSSTVHLSQPRRMAGVLELDWARVRWFLSVDGSDLPDGYLDSGRTAHRSITVDGEELDFTGGFEDLHTRVYERTLAGNGFGIEDARQSITMVHDIRTAQVETGGANGHPLLRTG
jgi:UDP-N-acetyl-2-amino-2-deoxyglucuronate dehydrogenase